ncbi:mucin-2 [Harpia harpyja]|uniref:mucin-2 n=1 Tax=Harpia harpyja TaxID=202280 RepID=UPI0022B1B8E7|nr:mucin-2 [Harpia harpyja]
MGRTRNHGHYVCSTWGNNHFKTFDGDIYQFPGICEYNFASDCQESYKEFSVHIQRALNSNNHPEIQYILITIKDFTVYLRPKLAVVDGRIVKTPYYSSGVLIESNDIYTKVYAKLGLILIWNQEDALMVELDSKFNNHTCGLCGDYNGVPIYNEFINGGASYNSITYGNLQKISKPNTKCEDPDETRALPSCNGHRNECERLLTSSAFADCRLRLNLETYIQACMQDKCACNGNEDSFCLCSTISEYSRQCSHVGGRPGEWRTQYFCPKTCPDTMIYRESSSPCMDTCSHLEISSLCEEHYMDGCFCPEGTVYDDITEKGCILASQCHCKLHGKEYSPGESITNECEECTCDSGRWMCKDLPCPGTCSVEGGSHITTFDGKKYTFHGDCYYVLAKGTVNDSHALLAELSPCGSTDRQTCLKTVVLLVDHKKNVVVFRSDGSVLLNEMTVNVPHVSASFSVFKPSSYYLVAQTSFGFQLQIQLFPVMQLFVTVDQSVQGKLQGLCGNFNGMEGDDFKTTSGLVEATGSAFANTWKAQSTCIDQVEKLEDPCSLSTESANYAEHWCSLLKNSEGPFARCHLIIDPSEYYKKCKYDTCLCEDNEECLCAALSSYSRACAFKGIILGGWRKNVCTSEVSACPGNQIFLYNLTMCQQTCRSLADGEKHCLQDFPPMDGCGCPYNTYLDNQDTCVPISKCPCYYKGSYLEPGEYVTKDGERCVCRNAKVQCTSVTIKIKSTTECSSNKMYFDCNASPKWTSQTPLQLSCHTPRTDHFQAECVSGCVCPEGLFDDGKGGCVEEKDCPCIHNNQWYSPGQKITVDCNTCTCQKGLWSCTEDVCYGTCMIYGSGHYITFDGKFYDFDGSCEYVATQDFCGDKNSSGSFSIITENVPCGTTGVTCSKAIKMFLGKTELKLENKDYKEIQRDIGDDVRYWNRTVGLYLVIEASNGVMLIWDKKTTVFIKLTPDYKGKVCGLCGNFDDKSNNDFTTRSGLQETNALKFGNSWKQSSMCPDITQEIKPCDVKPHRKSWAEKECSIIRSEVFKICHSKVDPIPFYEACVHDACSCDSGGDCECFCSAVAAYAQECTKAQACVFWRTPDICPIFCDYYNPRNECDWHYEPCGSNVTTCRMINNVSTNFSVPYLEGCYPRCPKDKPIYNEETKECVPEDQCWCYINGTHVPPGSEIPTEENCTKCVCGPSGSIQCTPIPGCPCVVNGTSYEVGEIVAQIQDGNICITYVCAENGSIVVGSTYPCPTSTSPTTTSTSFPTSTLTTTVITTSPPVTTTPCFGLICNWTQWFDVSKPEEDGGDYETYDAIRKEHGNKICEAPEDIECRAKDNPDMSLEELGQKVECNVTYGLICKNEEQDATMWQLCYNYEIRVNCCEWSEISCETTSTLSPTPTATSTTTSTTVPITTTVRQSTAITTMPIPTPTITSEFTPSVTTPVTSTSPAPPSSTTRTVSPPPVSTTAPTPTPSEPPSSTATTTMPPRSTTSSTLGTTTMVPGTPAPTPTTASTSMPTPTYTTTSSPPDCDCIWTDWIDVSYPNSSDRNSGDYETFENILKNDSSWVCAKAENISCRAQKFPHIPIADLGQKVECSVNTGLICNNSDQVIGGIIPMPVCLNYEISVCCIPNIPQCITSTTTSTTTAPPSSTTRTVSPPPVSTTAPTPTPSEPPSSTATTTMPPRSTTSSTLGTTTMVPGTPAPTPTTASTSMPTPTYTTTSSPPDCDCIWTDWIDVSYPNSSDRNSGDYETFENILKNDSSWVCAKAENISCRAQKFPHIPIADLGQKVECSVNTGLICNNSDQVIGGIIPMPVCLNYEISVCCIPNIPQCITSTTTSTTTAPPSSTTRTVSPPPVSTTAPTPTPSEPPSSTATTTMPPRSTTSSTLGTTTMVPGTPAPTPTTATTFTPPTIITKTPLPPSSEAIKGTTPEPRTPISTIVTPSATPQPTTRTTEIQSIVSTTGTTIQQSITSVSTSPVTVSTSGVTETGSTTKTTTSGPTPSGPTPHSTTTVMETSSHETSTTGTGSPPTGPPSSTTSTTTSGPSSPMSTASTTVSPPPVSTSPVTVSTSGVTETGSTTKTTTSGPTPSGPTPHSTTTVMETSSHETSTTGTGSPPTGPPSSTTSTTTSGPSSPMSTASTTVSPPPVSTSPVTVSTSGVTETGSTTKTTTSGPTPSGPTPHSTTTVMETSSHETSTTGTGSPPTGPPSSTTSTTTSGPSSPMSTASTTVSPPPVSTSPVTVSTSGVTETGSTTKTTTSGPTPSGPTPHSTTTVMETSSHETSTTGTGSPLTGPPSSTTSTTTSGPSSPMSTASTTVSPPPVSTSPVTVSTSGVTETGSTTKTTTSGPTPSGPTPHSTTTVMETSSHETSTTGTGSPPTGPPSSTTSTTTSGPSSPMSTASTTVSPPPVSTSPVTVSTSGVTETGSTTKTTTSGPTPSGPTPHSTTTVMETSSHETSTTGTGSPPTGPPSSTTSTTTSGPSSPMSTASTTVSPPPVSTSPVTVSTSGVTETGSTTKTTTSGPTPSGPTPHSTTTVMETSSHETSTTGTGSPPTGPPSSTTSTTTSGPSSPMSTASTTVSPPPVSTSPVTVSTSGVTETGSTTKTTTSGPTPSGPTPHSTTTVMETSSHESSTTGTGSPPTGPPSSTTSTTTSGPSSPMSTASTTVSPPPVSTSPVTVSTSGVTETGSTTKTTTSGPTPSGPTPHSTTTVMETSSHETSTTGTGSPPTGPPSSTTSTTTSGPSSPMSTASTTVSPPPVSTSPVTVSTSGVTETGSTTISGPTPSGPTPVSETGSPMTTTSTRTTPTRSTAITTTMTSGPSSIESAATTTVSPPSVSTSIMPVTTSGTTPTESFTTTLGTTSRNFTTITATTSTSTSEFFSPGSTSTSGPTATSSSVTITGSSTYSTVTPLSASSSTTTPPPTTPGRNCSVFPNESYAPGESWWICDCIKAICIEDNIIQVVPVICNPPPKPTCANGLSPVQVIDEDGCCWHWECDCYCTGWGDPHYMTFDGLYYSYQGNCTYVLVEEIYKKVDNFGVYIDNYHCDTRDVVSCPRTLIVRHETQEVRMATVKPNTLQVEVTVNKQAVALPYKKFGLSIYESGINRVVEIPELKMNVTYNGLSFSIRMPYSLFGNNTHGQCGTCNNNTADDCMLPNGKIAENCETMADHWQVVDPSKPQCSPGLIPTKAPSTTPTQPCKESSICELLLGSLFEPCHGFVQPEKYYAACVFDSCVLPNLDLECSSLQTYAATCADQSVCIDWRSHTNGVCSYKCPSDKEYRACGPIKEITCKSSQQNETSTKQVEGCFCPNGTMLYDSGVDVCVKTCGCVGVDKIPREFGEKFTVDCQDCICLEGGNGIVCEPHECAKQNKTSCDGEGFYEVNEVNSEDSCCPIVTCKCNTSLCTSKAPKCTLGFEVHSHIPRGQCCPVYQCVPKRVCVHQNAEFLPNSSVFVDKCQNCFCTNEVNISTQLNIISCEHIPCNTYCEPGYERQPVKGECCGRCVQTKCVIHTSDNSDLILSPGEFKNDPYNNCTIYSCVNIHNQLISSTSEITCPAFNEESCKPGTITFLPNGCCRTCAPLDSPTPCSVRQRKDFIIYKGCHSVDRVVMTECEGTCGTSSLYSAEANSMDHSCSCCRESRTTVREVELKCPTGHSVSHKYIYVESCSCQDTECSSSQSSELQSTEENDKASTLNRIKRAISLTAK